MLLQIFAFKNFKCQLASPVHLSPRRKNFHSNCFKNFTQFSFAINFPSFSFHKGYKYTTFASNSFLFQAQITTVTIIYYVSKNSNTQLEGIHSVR